jgi:hypothetical protein
VKLPWPEVPSERRPGESIRRILDYLAWISRHAQQRGFHPAPEHAFWRRRVEEAYVALFVPVIVGYGDPYPPDVPPAEHPGEWPDVAAARVVGMTIRHQLKVIGLLAETLRQRVWVHARAEDVAAWDERLCRAREALDHGDAVPIPEEALTAPSKEALEEVAAQRKAMEDHSRRRMKRLERAKAVADERRAKASRLAAKEARKAARTKVPPARKPPARKPPARKKVAKKKPAPRRPVARKGAKGARKKR